MSTNTFPLPPYGGDPDHITLSGFASGASMATRMHVIYSSTFKGVGLIGGGPYGPPRDGDISEDRFLNAAKAYETTGYIDGLFNINRAPVFILSLTEDKVSPPIW